MREGLQDRALACLSREETDRDGTDASGRALAAGLVREFAFAADVPEDIAGSCEDERYGKTMFVPDALSRTAGGAFGTARSIRREIGGHILAADGWKNPREKGIFGHGSRSASVIFERSTLRNDFLLYDNDLRHVRRHLIPPC